MKLLIGIDDSPHSRAAVDLVCRMVWPSGTHALVVSVIPPAMPVHSEIHGSAEWMTRLHEHLVREHERVVAATEGVLRASGIEASSQLMHGDARVELLDAARSHQPDLLVVGSHGRTGLAKLILGSVAHHVVTHAECSVLVVKVRP